MNQRKFFPLTNPTPWQETYFITASPDKVMQSAEVRNQSVYFSFQCSPFLKDGIIILDFQFAQNSMEQSIFEPYRSVIQPLWTCKSTRRLAKELTKSGHPVSHAKVGQLLATLTIAYRERGKGWKENPIPTETPNLNLQLRDNLCPD